MWCTIAGHLLAMQCTENTHFIPPNIGIYSIQFTCIRISMYVYVECSTHERKECKRCANFVIDELSTQTSDSIKSTTYHSGMNEAKITITINKQTQTNKNKNLLVSLIIDPIKHNQIIKNHSKNLYLLVVDVSLRKILFRLYE